MRVIYIRKLPYEAARQKLEREIQEAFVAGESYVEIVHGIGEGILKRMTLEYVQSQSYLSLVERSPSIPINPGTTLVEILSPGKEVLRKYVKS